MKFPSPKFRRHESCSPPKMPGHHSKFAGWFQPKNRWTVHHLQRWRTNDVHSLKLKWMVQRLVSFWEALYSGAMLVLGSVREKVVSAAKQKGCCWRSSLSSDKGWIRVHSVKMTASKSPWKNRPKMSPKRKISFEQKPLIFLGVTVTRC